MLPLTLVLFAFAYDLDAVKAEPNLDRRADLALVNATAALDRAKTLYKDAEYSKSMAAVAEIGESVNVCHDALKATGKDPRKNSKQFKKVEQRIHSLVRRLKGFEQEVSVEDRPGIKKVITRLEDVNEEIVSGIFTKTKT
jgi:hypothetical protein